jgi:UDP-glucose 4-epimerase
MKICITGAAGFIGSHVFEACVDAGYEAIAMDNLSHGKESNLPIIARLYNVDITKKEVEFLLKDEKPDFVIHLAAQVDVSTSVDNSLTDASVNIMGTLNLLEACCKAGVRKVVYISSAAVYGHPQYLPIDEEHPVLPLSPYGISKYVPEMYLRHFFYHYGLEYTVLRYANVYGPRQDPSGEGSVVAIFIDRLLKGETPVIYGDGEQTRDFIYVKDVAQGTLQALEGGNGAVFNVSSGKRVSVNELYAMLQKLMGNEITARYAPPRPGDILHSCLANRKARKKLGWEPRYSLSEGLAETVLWRAKRSR